MKRIQRHPRLRLALFLATLLLLLSACGFPGMASTSAQLPAVKPHAQSTPLPPIRFPQDEAPHRDLTEWWYYTGHLQGVGPDGRAHRYGFEFVIFQALRSDLPPVYAAHFAISDITRGEFHYAQLQQMEPGAVIPNGTSTQGIDLHVAGWSIRGLNGHDQLQAAQQNYAMQLDLQANKPPVLHNGTGLITYSLAGFSYYYSRTRMAVSGTLLDHNQPLKVSGQAWMDHQWGNFLTLKGSGWDWFSIQLDNNSELMLYVIRDAAGRVVSTYAGYIDPRGADALIPAGALRMTVLDHWTSPVTHATYPSGWRIEISDPRAPVSLTLTPQLKDQELVTYQSTGNTYWEGAVSIQGQSAGRPVQGEGYVELTGYSR